MIQYIMDDQDQLSFNFRGKNSLTDFGIIILKSNHLSSPELNLTLEQVPGRNGSVVIDEGGLKNLSLSFDCALDSKEEDINDRARKIKMWLLSNRDYTPLVISDDPKYYLEAVVSSKLDIEELVTKVGSFKLYFSCKPIRKRVRSSLIDIEQGYNLRNNGYVSEPLMHLEGTGDITININSQELILKGVNGYMTIDCELMDAYRVDKVTGILTSENNKMWSNFPILEPGDNIINWTGELSSLKIDPRGGII